MSSGVVSRNTSLGLRELTHAESTTCELLASENRWSKPREPNTFAPMDDCFTSLVRLRGMTDARTKRPDDEPRTLIFVDMLGFAELTRRNSSGAIERMRTALHRGTTLEKAEANEAKMISELLAIADSTAGELDRLQQQPIGDRHLPQASRTGRSRPLSRESYVRILQGGESFTPTSLAKSCRRRARRCTSRTPAYPRLLQRIQTRWAGALPGPPAGPRRYQPRPQCS
jgi:hypothetical protein